MYGKSYTKQSEILFHGDEMTSIFLVDGAKYELWIPEEEAEFEEIVKEHSKEIFGNDSLYVDVKKRIKSESGIISIPDGYLVDFSNNSLWIVEVELSKHPLHRHLVAQLNTFISGIKDREAQKEITEAIYSVIKGDILLEAFVKKRLGSKDIHHFLSELLENLNIIVVIEELNKKVEKAFENFKVQPYFVELKTFVRANVGIGAHAHLVKVPEEWEERLLPFHAVYDENKKVFLCNCGGEAHKNRHTYNASEIGEHLLSVHGIPLDNQLIEGWTDDFEKQLRKYLAKKYLKT